MCKPTPLYTYANNNLFVSPKFERIQWVQVQVLKLGELVKFLFLVDWDDRNREINKNRIGYTYSGYTCMGI
jgi:hypothetical protein